jgi:hypothetical protein
MDLMGDGDCGGGLGFAAVFRKLRKSSKNQGEGKLRFFCGKVLILFDKNSIIIRNFSCFFGVFMI